MPGSAGGSFGNNGTDPQVQDIAGRRCVTFSGSNWMKATFTAPSAITGSHAFTVAGWLYNPSIASEEAYLTWARRGSTARCAQFNYGNAAAYGAVTHYSADLGFVGLTGNAPSAGVWHHIAITYDGTTEKVYVDGIFNNSAARALNIYTSQPVFLGTSYTDSAGSSKAMGFSGSIASLKVYSEALSAADILTLSGIVTYKITGVVRAGGSPLSGATVCLNTSPNATVNPTASTTTGTDGSYSFTVQPGTYYVAAKKSGYAPKPTPDLTVTVTNADVGGKDFAVSYVGVTALQPFDLSRITAAARHIQRRPGPRYSIPAIPGAGQVPAHVQADGGPAGAFGNLWRVGGSEPWSFERPPRRALHLGLRADVCRNRQHGAEKPSRLHGRRTGKMPGGYAQPGLQPRLPVGLPGIWFIDRVEAQQSVSAPYYTLHKIMAGLYDAYIYCGNQQALTVLSNMAAWCKTRCDKLSDSQMQWMLNNEFGGMGEVLANLYSVTGNPDHLALAQRFDKAVFTNPLAQGIDNLPGYHANTHIPQVIAAARLFELTQTDHYDSIAENFWNICTSAHCYPNGGTSDGEYWQNRKHSCEPVG